MNKALPIGYEDFRKILNKNLYYVDKTEMIKELLDDRGEVNLITRPRRFGKTLNLSMLRRFFEIEIAEDGSVVSNSYLFENLKIASCGEAYMIHQGKYPIISLSLKSAKQPNFEMAYEVLLNQIISEYKRHYYLIKNEDMFEVDRRRYMDIVNRKGSASDYATALAFLSECLAKYHKKNVIVLIDEYDVPLENAYFEGFYDEMIGFIRSLFESVLKTNPYLEFAVITGCLRISKESIFTGLNNLKIHSIKRMTYDDCFGFTEEEVKEMLAYYDLSDKFGEVQKWYDGYLFGNKEIYNPWSIINYVDSARLNRNAFPEAYWSNTSSNSIIKELIENADRNTKKEIEDLIAGDCIEKPVHEEITYADIHASQDNLWNFLYFTGYLRKCGERQEGRNKLLEMKIPNEEITFVFEQTVLNWFESKIQDADITSLITAFESGECENIEQIISTNLMDTISFYDYAENFYHGFLTGLLKSSNKYEILSNRESGLGRSDILMKEYAFRGKAILLELKVAHTFAEMEGLCEKALQQIEAKQYETALRAEGCREVHKYGVCFYKKGCMVAGK
ncbi:MAG: AAA family ATPase [Lachnospiraceae bacterium]|nr:AAA family ATPase [Lachnospiraceae bacterium]